MLLYHVIMTPRVKGVHPLEKSDQVQQATTKTQTTYQGGALGWLGCVVSPSALTFVLVRRRADIASNPEGHM